MKKILHLLAAVFIFCVSCERMDVADQVKMTRDADKDSVEITTDFSKIAVQDSKAEVIMSVDGAQWKMHWTDKVSVPKDAEVTFKVLSNKINGFTEKFRFIATHDCRLAYDGFSMHETDRNHQVYVIEFNHQILAGAADVKILYCDELGNPGPGLSYLISGEDDPMIITLDNEDYNCFIMVCSYNGKDYYMNFDDVLGSVSMVQLTAASTPKINHINNDCMFKL